MSAVTAVLFAVIFIALIVFLIAQHKMYEEDVEIQTSKDWKWPRRYWSD